jgi:hypothetical protein
VTPTASSAASSPDAIDVQSISDAAQAAKPDRNTDRRPHEPERTAPSIPFSGESGRVEDNFMELMVTAIILGLRFGDAQSETVSQGPIPHRRSDD